MASLDLSTYHERTRRRGVNSPVYWVVRAILQPFLLVYFRLDRIGREHVPAQGPALIAPNHRSFLDPFVIGTCIRRPIYFMAKRELFKNRFVGWILNCLGAFPVKRGEADEDAMETARLLLERGEAVLIFPEGTRIRRGSLGKPKRGVGRLALETGAPVVPVAVTGSEHVRRGLRIRPKKVRVRLGRPLTFPRVEKPSAHLASEVTARIWPCVELQWEWLGGMPPLRKAAVVGGGSMGTATAILLARAGLDVQLGCRSSAQVAEISADGENHHLPGVPLPPGVDVTTAGSIEFAGVDLVVYAVPSKQLPTVVAQVGAQIGERTAVLVLTKGLVAPLGALPTKYVAERVRARAVASLGGPAHAAEAIEHGAAVVLATESSDFGEQLGKALAQSGLHVSMSDDVVGTELAGCAKNAAAFAAAAAAGCGMNSAGAAAGHVFSEVHSLALANGGRSETFAGLAGAGDLVGTVIAEGSRNRRAGDLLGHGVPAEHIPAMLGQVSESLDTVPLLASAMAEHGIEAPALTGLAELIAGRTTPRVWVAELRNAGARHARRAA
jgi:1-acyl-sn-glycerol-3-phosphate acyltransferase